MTSSSVSISGIPTGGGFSLGIVSSGAAMVLSRAVSGVSGLSSFSQIYSGTPIPLFIDVGDGLPAPLASGSYYVYQLQDGNGTYQTPAVQPALQLNIEQEPLLALLIRLLQAGFNNLVPPAGVSACQVLQAMPIAGLPAMPFVVVNLDLFQQAEIPIGQNVPQFDPSGSWTISGFAKRIFRVSVLASNTADRDYYRDATVAILESIIQSVFLPIGLDVRHRYQAASGQVTENKTMMNPGFYYCDVMLEVEGTYNISITSTFGVINTITLTGTTPDGEAVIQTQVPA